MKTKLHAISAAVLIATAAAAPAHAELERVGPNVPASVDPRGGGYPAWFQDKTGITLEFCSLTTQAEWDNGWCLLAPPDGPAGGLPEVFPTNFFDEHFFYAADNVLLDANNGLRAKLVLALEGAFAMESPIEGDQVVFSRHRVDMRPLPFDGDYRVITPFMDVTYTDQVAGDRIFDTADIGIACPGTYECTLNGTLGPFLLPSPVAGGREVPPMPDLAANPGLDPWYAALVQTGSTTAAPGTNKKYLADPARVGPVTGSPLADFTAFNADGSSGTRNHNTFRIEVRSPSPTHDGPVIYVLEGENNFSVAGRLMTGNLPGRVSASRAVYRADASGAMTDIDVFATGLDTVQARLPGQAPLARTKPMLSFYGEPCAGAISVVNGAPRVNQPPYGAPSGADTPMTSDEGSSDFWGQRAAAGTPPSHVCIVDHTARNAAGQLAPAYTLRALTDDVRIQAATYDGAQNGALAVTAVSSDPTAALTLAGFGARRNADGTYSGRGPGADLSANAVTVTGVRSPPNVVQVVSNRGGANSRPVDTARGGVVVAAGEPIANTDSATVNEDGGQIVVDLLANDTVVVNGASVSLRQVVQNKSGTVTLNVVQGARMGTGTVSTDGRLTYRPNANASGTDSITYTVSYNGGTASNPAVANIVINPLNDRPTAVNTTVNAVMGYPVTFNLLANSTDPDGNGTLAEAVTSVPWPTALGTRPVRIPGGSITVKPTAAGNHQILFRAVDSSGAFSLNTATTTVQVAASEVITVARARLVTNGVRWRIDGTDAVLANQTLTIAFNDGRLANGTSCNGTANVPQCVITTTALPATGAWAVDQSFGAGSPQDLLNPTGVWAQVPTQVRVFSSAPSYGGSATFPIELK